MKWNVVSREFDDGLGEDCEASLEVDGSTAINESVANCTGERIQAPFFTFDSNDIGMRRQQHRLLGAIPFEPSDEVSLARIRGRYDIDVKA